jgi:hypothetical protein
LYLVDLGKCPNVASGGQPDALLAMRAFVGLGLAPTEMQQTVDIDNWIYL